MPAYECVGAHDTLCYEGGCHRDSQWLPLARRGGFDDLALVLWPLTAPQYAVHLYISHHVRYISKYPFPPAQFPSPPPLTPLSNSRD